jgi:hypothetical protein
MPPDPAERFQTRFHRRWKHLHDPHVRALAWLLDAPDLLDPDAPRWLGRVASLGAMDAETADWLAALDRSPADLQARLGVQPLTRLGRYAEKLMAFYFEHQGSLVAHGLQVRGANNETVGEFDFLLQRGGELVHWEFASKFYLLESNGASLHADCFVGPNLADTLGAKVRKIMERQLSLSRHPAASSQLPGVIASAQALVKGWLFYYRQTPQPAGMEGVSVPHCRGFWRPLSELGAMEGESYMVLPRLLWLAPAKAAPEECMDKPAIEEWLHEHFATETMPVLVAIMTSEGGALLETDRGFIVPDDWRGRAGERIRRMIAAAE